MAYRPIQTSIWKDQYFFDLETVEKLAFTYLLTNDFTTQSGVYELSMSHAAMETGLSTERLIGCFQKFQEDGKIVYSFPTREVAIINWRKFNENKSYKTMERVRKELSRVKNPELVLHLYDPRVPLCDANIKKKTGEMFHAFVENPWKEQFKDLTDNELIEIRVSINKGYRRGINTPSTITDSYTEQTHNKTNSQTGGIEAAPKPQPPTNWDDDEPAITYPKPQPEIPPSQDPIQESASELITQIINHWNGKSNLPNCRYQSFSIPGISDFTAKLSVFSLSEIIKSIDNLSELWEKIEPKYRHRTLSKFIVKIDDWTDEAEPWERYKSGNASTVSPEEAERLAAEAFPSRGE